MVKYARRPEYSLDSDYRYYLGKENLFGVVLGWKMKPAQNKKADYIWQSLLAQDMKVKKKRGKK